MNFFNDCGLCFVWWSHRAPSCFEISWPWRSNAGFFKKPNKLIYSEADRFVSESISPLFCFCWNPNILCMEREREVVHVPLLSLGSKIVFFLVGRAQPNQLQEPAKPEQEEAVDEERKVGKTHFVEHRTGLHLYHSFHRFWIFLVCMLQVCCWYNPHVSKSAKC